MGFEGGSGAHPSMRNLFRSSQLRVNLRREFLAMDPPEQLLSESFSGRQQPFSGVPTSKIKVVKKF
ncbi:MAG: hypothetical protein CL676_10815 [Bdellovibrionaceae bacterium]|nr:hypothetical protein [Pseudobdellovibrionaceae bacterium]|tara:strand:+ start:2419 stop:2616 length:198 start_codon:yes stop_codon:yes gene_type:complete